MFGVIHQRLRGTADCSTIPVRLVRLEDNAVEFVKRSPMDALRRINELGSDVLIDKRP